MRVGLLRWGLSSRHSFCSRSADALSLGKKICCTTLYFFTVSIVAMIPFQFLIISKSKLGRRSGVRMSSLHFKIYKLIITVNFLSQYLTIHFIQKIYISYLFCSC